MKKQTTTQIINGGISFLAQAQMRDGGFESFSSASEKKFAREKTYRSVFPVALILSCLHETENSPETMRIKKAAVKFLLAQKSEYWSFNYWVRNAQEAKTMPYPDDLDDTFCALSALSLYDKNCLDASALAKIVSLLTFAEETEGGPYYTWLVPKDAKNTWRDVDLAVNANIAYFLSLQEIELPKVTALIEKAIDTEHYSSPYYPSAYPIIYFISRFYRGEKAEKLRVFLSKNKKYAKNPLTVALAISALLRLGTDPKKLEKDIEYLKKHQKNGCWGGEAFCLDPTFKGKTYYAGSAAMTTAFCIESLALYEKMSAQKTKQETSDKVAKELREKIIREAKNKFSSFHANLEKEAHVRLHKTLLGDKDGSIVLLPYFFHRSLAEADEKISEKTLVSLGLANLYGWMAYTIYDDFLDDEGDPKLLSLANACLRELTEIFFHIGQKASDFKEIYTHIMDALDSANTWEVANCRTKNTRIIPKYDDFSCLAERSLGHALGPIAILCLLGHDSLEIKHAKKFFENYLIARQLNDDAHDWEEDVRRGHINPVCAELMRRAKRKILPENFTEEDILTLRNIFWGETIESIAAQILAFGKSARKSLKKMKSVKDTSLFEKLLLPIETSAKEAVREKKKTSAFLQAY